MLAAVDDDGDDGGGDWLDRSCCHSVHSLVFIFDGKKIISYLHFD